MDLMEHTLIVTGAWVVNVAVAAAALVALRQQRRREQAAFEADLRAYDEPAAGETDTVWWAANEDDTGPITIPCTASGNRVESSA
jgi:hypothetical protein